MNYELQDAILTDIMKEKAFELVKELKEDCKVHHGKVGKPTFNFEFKAIRKAINGHICQVSTNEGERSIFELELIIKFPFKYLQYSVVHVYIYRWNAKRERYELEKKVIL